MLSPRYIQHSARVLFELGKANQQERAQILDAVFDLSRDEVVRRVHAGKMDKIALQAHDYIFDIFPAAEEQQRPVAASGGQRSA